MICLLTQPFFFRLLVHPCLLEDLSAIFRLRFIVNFNSVDLEQHLDHWHSNYHLRMLPIFDDDNDLAFTPFTHLLTLIHRQALAHFDTPDTAVKTTRRLVNTQIRSVACFLVAVSVSTMYQGEQIVQVNSYTQIVWLIYPCLTAVWCVRDLFQINSQVFHFNLISFSHSILCSSA